MPRPPSDRPVRIADAAIELIATSGLHAVTHRAIDAHLGYPQGTTSYYARTRAELLARATELLAERFDSEIDVTALDGVSSDDEAIAVIVGMMGRLREAETDRIAHYVLTIELRNDPGLAPLLGASSPARLAMHRMTASLIERCGYADVDENASGLLSLLNGLMLASLTGNDDVPVESAVATFWRGMQPAVSP
jgi:AcrR family transcriptional regulator